MLLTGCSPEVEIDYSGPVADWPYWGGNAGASHFSPLDQITPENVSALEVAWTHHSGDYYDGSPDPANLILSAAPLHVLQAVGDVDENGDITASGEGWVMKDCRAVPGKGEECGYYQYLQGTSMASPHAAGVAALVVSAHGKVQGKAGFTLAPDRTAEILMDTARNTACPAGDGGLYDYDPPIPPSYNAVCDGDADFNGFYGDGIVNALGAVS